MIVYVAPRAGTFGLGEYLEGEGLAERHRVLVLAYEDVLGCGEFPLGNYIFSALEQLTPTETALVVRAREALAQAMPGALLLNDPLRAVHRYELLAKAYESGRNGFRVSRVTDFDRRHRFPVFLRSEREHTGSLTPLLHSQREVDREILMAWLRGFRLRDLLVVEYCDTSDADGVFRKYSAMIVGDRIIPRNICHNRNWITKFDAGRLLNAAYVTENSKFLDQDPHQLWLRESFALAGAEFGRIDYGVLNGKPQIWEINFNPTVGGGGADDAPEGGTTEMHALITRARLRFVEHFNAALAAIDSGADPAQRVRIPISDSERDQMAREKKLAARIHTRRTVVGQLARPAGSLYRLGRRGAKKPQVNPG